MNKLSIIKSILSNIIDNIDAGNSNITEEEGTEIIDLINQITNVKNKLSKYQACKFLNISRSTFDLYVKEGKLPKGQKQQGFKELFWIKEDLIKYKNNR